MSDCLHDPCTDGQEQERVQNQRQPNRSNREELVDDLADQLAQLQDESDIQRIEQLLEEIKQTDPGLPEFDVEQSFNRFKEKYGHLFPADPPEKTKRRKPLRYIARTAAIIAILLVIFLGAAQAAGFNIMSIFPWWNGEQFHFSEETDGSANTVDELPQAEFESLQAALDAYDIQTPLVPSKLPDGAALERLFIEEKDGQPIFSAKYVFPDGNLFITIKQTTEVPFSDVEKNEENIETHIVNGIEHRIMEDEGIYKAIWYNGIWEGYIYGDISQDDLIAMIDSIYQ